jgi:hypothetical protein
MVETAETGATDSTAELLGVVRFASGTATMLRASALTHLASGRAVPGRVLKSSLPGFLASMDSLGRVPLSPPGRRQ